MVSSRLVFVVIICVGIGIAIGSTVNPTPEDSINSVTTDLQMNDGGLSGTVDVGILLPLTGGQSTHGIENTAAAMLAIDDFNNYLESIGQDWTIRGLSDDTATSPLVAIEKLTAFNAKGIQLIIGPETSAEIRAMIGYSNSNGMLMFSPSSTAPTLAIPNDSVYRMTPDDTRQGPALAALAKDLEKTILIPVWRGDAWGDGLTKTASESFRTRGGVVDEGVRYNPEIVEFSATMSLLDEKVGEYIEQSGADNIVILLVAFSEAIQIMQSASYYDSLNSVQWLGTDGNAKEHKIVDDPVANEFANNVKFTAIQIAATHNSLYNDVSERLGSQFAGNEPNGYAFITYDATWVLGTSMLYADSNDVEILKKVIPVVAGHNFGTIGPTRLNSAGDLDGSDYDLWLVNGNEWINNGQYFLDNDLIVLKELTS